MPDLAEAGVELVDSYLIGDKTGKKKGVRKTFRLTLTGQGGTINRITASVLGLSKIDRAYTAVTDSDTLVQVSPSYDGTLVLLYGVTNLNPTDVTDTILITVEGS